MRWPFAIAVVAASAAENRPSVTTLSQVAMGGEPCGRDFRTDLTFDPLARSSQPAHSTFCGTAGRVVRRGLLLRGAHLLQYCKFDIYWHDRFLEQAKTRLASFLRLGPN
jgi:hypothetical protein